MPRPAITAAPRRRSVRATAALAPLAAALLAAAVLACQERRDATAGSEPGAAGAVSSQAPAAPPLRDESAKAVEMMPLSRPAPNTRPALGFAAGEGSAAAPAAPGSTADSAVSADGRIAPDMVIRRGQAIVQVDSLDAAVARLRQLAAREGGVVANSSLRGGRDQVRSAMLELRVPAARFDDLVAGLDPFGKVETVDVTAEDVGEEYVDVGARVANARRLESRLVDILAKRAGKLGDVLAVERELARVREEIERHEGRLRYLRTRSAVSTLAVTLHEPYPILAGAPATNPITHAFVEAWRNFVALLAATIAAMGVLLPVGALAGLAWLGVRRWRQGEAASRQQQA